MKLTAQASHRDDTVLRINDGSTSIIDDYKSTKQSNLLIVLNISNTFRETLHKYFEQNHKVPHTQESERDRQQS